MDVEWDEIRPKFRDLRARRGLDSLAVTIGASRASIDRWSRGVTEPLPIFAHRIATLVMGEPSQVRHRTETR